MSNNYFSHSNPVTRFTLARAEAINQIFQAVVSGFDKLPTPDEIKQGRITYGTDSGSANAYVVTMPHPISVYTEGLTVSFKPQNANTGASTINVDGVGIKPIRRASGDALIAENLTAGMVATVRYNGAEFRLTSTNQADVLAAAASAAEAATRATQAETARDKARDWATETQSDVDNSGEYSAKEYAQGGLEAHGGSAKAWAIDGQSPDGTSSQSARTHAQAAKTARQSIEQKLTISNDAPTAADGQNGDVWFKIS